MFHGSGSTYGSPKVFIELVRTGWRVSVNTVVKVMAELGPAGRKIRGRRADESGQTGSRPGLRAPGRRRGGTRSCLGVRPHRERICTTARRACSWWETAPWGDEWAGRQDCDGGSGNRLPSP
ncbi:IS3 family transposase [Streptomyces sp. NPDC046870]|uniref:IS3 family transposase n=1 Tax=Streptomyces sp. NPDC046870 TaxID=3155135 RepID=UPI003453A222